MTTEDKIRAIEEMAEMYHSEFGEDARYDAVKAIIGIVRDFFDACDAVFQSGDDKDTCVPSGLLSAEEIRELKSGSRNDRHYQRCVRNSQDGR